MACLDVNWSLEHLVVTLANIWEGMDVKLTFRRIFSDEMFCRWLELSGVVEEVQYTGSGDSLVWQHECNRVYSSQSLCWVF